MQLPPATMGVCCRCHWCLSRPWVLDWLQCLRGAHQFMVASAAWLFSGMCVVSGSRCQLLRKDTGAQCICARQWLPPVLPQSSLGAHLVTGSAWCPPVWGSQQMLEGMGRRGGRFCEIKSATNQHACIQMHTHNTCIICACSITSTNTGTHNRACNWYMHVCGTRSSLTYTYTSRYSRGESHPPLQRRNKSRLSQQL